MATIGRFQPVNPDTYEGYIETLTIPRVEITLKRVPQKSEKSPSWRLYRGETEVGYAYDQTNANGPYLSVTLDDPSWQRAVYAHLYAGLDNPKERVLVWRRS